MTDCFLRSNGQFFLTSHYQACIHYFLGLSSGSRTRLTRSRLHLHPNSLTSFCVLNHHKLCRD